MKRTLSFLEKLGRRFERLMVRYNVLKGITVPDSIEELKKKLDTFEGTLDTLSLLLKSKKFRKVFVKLLKIAMPEIGKSGYPTEKYLINTMTETEAFQVIIALWAYNFAAEVCCKKKVQSMLKKLINKKEIKKE